MSFLQELMGDNPKRCDHEAGFSSINWIQPSPEQARHSSNVTDQQDFDYAVENMGFPADATVIGLCPDCQDGTPSRISQTATLKGQQDKRVAQAAGEREELLVTLDNGAELWHCANCDSLTEEAPAIRECPHCETEFAAEDGERNCPDCNRPFTSKLHAHGCGDCMEAVTLVTARTHLATEDNVA